MEGSWSLITKCCSEKPKKSTIHFSPIVEMRSSYQISCSYFFWMFKARGGGGFYIKPTGKLVVSLWGVNCRFWSHLRFLGWKVTILVCLFRYRLVLRKRNFQKLPWHWPHRNLPWGSVWAWATPTLVSLRGLIWISAEHPRHFYMGVPPRGLNSFRVFQASTKKIWWAWGTLDGGYRLFKQCWILMTLPFNLNTKLKY